MVAGDRRPERGVRLPLRKARLEIERSLTTRPLAVLWVTSVTLVTAPAMAQEPAPRSEDSAAAPPGAATGDAPSADAAPTAPPAPAEVRVRGRASEARRLQESAEAVTVVETRRARQQSSDLGEVMARTQGVAVRRAGGLGSNARFSLNGLYDDQIRFFLDGVPLDLAGYPLGIANVPVNLVERADIYRGVVPIRFGADALGGAVNLVTDQRYETGGNASYQIGSFGTNRLTLAARTRHDPSGFVVRGTGFLDLAKNNYRVDVEVPDERGRLRPATVTRFHDGYVARGGSLEVGFVDRPWARRLLLNAFASAYGKELQNNTVMTVPYGEVNYGEAVYGATLRYEQPLFRNLELEALGNYAYRTIDFVDRSIWVYDWFGRRVRERRVAGEIQTDKPTDQTLWQHSALARTTLTWTIAPEHVLRASLSPTFTTRTGDERLQADPRARDPLTAKRDLFTFVSGVEYQVDAIPVPNERASESPREHRLQNVVFAKDYLYNASSEEVLVGGGFRPRSTDSHSLGVGDSLRFRVSPWLYAKASYEYATRLPRPDEVFGDGKLITANLGLEPEVSHNGNVGPRFELRRSAIGDLTVDVNGFWRESDRLIVMLNSDRFFTYQNVFRARALGVEGSAAWSSPGRWLTVDGSTTFQDVRNVGDEGAFADFEGDRIPNRPWLFASWGARLRFPRILASSDELEPFYMGRYVHSFFRGWESQGAREFKQVVDAQITHGLGLTYSVRNDLTRISSTFEVQNLTDARVYDYFGVQRPGRAFFIKLTAEL
ncbi:MAG: TonB-dependent receptor [Labilithrix sp.]|nr:TonB-dependent receptor [Labilithrix sp.]